MQSNVPDPARAERSGEASAGAGRFTSLLRLETVDSTNRLAADLALHGLPEGVVVVADEQVAGRGRRGRVWFSPPGASLLCSFLLRPPFGADDAHLASACVALAAIDAIHELTGLRVGMKWPNDLMVGEAKLAGLLAEWVTPPGEQAAEEGRPPDGALIVGLGVNLDFPADAAQRPGYIAPTGAITVAEASGVSLTADQLLQPLLAHLERRYQPLADRVPGTRLEIAADRRAACITIGQRVQVERVRGPAVNGTARDVGDDGRLLVHIDDGRVLMFEEGDIVHLRPAPNA